VRYRIDNKIIIRSENAAKPSSQRSAYLASVLNKLPIVGASFDYGCGKLRYYDLILRSTGYLVLVDSEIQLSRSQILARQRTSVRRFIGRSNRVTVANVAEFGGDETQFDWGFCINLLSVIPILATRERVIRLIHSKLRPGATCVFVVKFRNSDFTRMGGMLNARIWRDGILIDSLRGFSFYALIKPDQLVSMLIGGGFQIADLTLNDGSAYIVAQSRWGEDSLSQKSNGSLSRGEPAFPTLPSPGESRSTMWLP
jgi:SAM-dependent methyltransferase